MSLKRRIKRNGHSQLQLYVEGTGYGVNFYECVERGRKRAVL